jgi:MerR family transcriptional regulator, light-induced transcriptional regulator
MAILYKLNPYKRYSLLHALKQEDKSITRRSRGAEKKSLDYVSVCPPLIKPKSLKTGTGSPTRIVMSEQNEFFDGDNKPLYNIGAVSRMTDVAETTLRVWERRYTFPNSARTDGGHRLYSQHEVTRVQWVKARIDMGLQVSQAIKALQQLEQAGGSVELQATLRYTKSIKNSDAFATFYDSLLNALLDYDTILADSIIAEALTIYSLEHVILDIFSPILREIGHRWASGELDVAGEHLISNFLRQRLLQWMRTSPPAYHVNPILLACAPGELHEGSLLMLGVLLSRLRWSISYLGQSIAMDGLEAFIKQLQPAVIVFVAMTEASIQELSEWFRWLPHVHAAQQPPVCFGGRAFTEQPELVERVPGIFLGQSLQEGVVTLDKMLSAMYPFAHRD